MGTNYYLVKDFCDTCGRYDETHIGKSSYGWKFTFSNKLGKTKEEVFKEIKKGDKIVNEYGEDVSVEELSKLIESKQDDNEHTDRQHFYQDNDGYDFMLVGFC